MSRRFVLTLAVFVFFLSGALFLFKDSLVNNFRPQALLSELNSPNYVKFIKGQTGLWNPNFSQPVFLNAPAAKPLAISAEQKVLGLVSDKEEKWIEVDISDQKLYAHEGEQIIYEFLVSTGKWARTPIGEFRTWSKFRYLTMNGGDKAQGTYYHLPNVPYVMFFYNGFALHGTYWHNNFGVPMSHGCVNLSIPNAEKLYFWTNPQVKEGQSAFYPTALDQGTRVIIHE